LWTKQLFLGWYSYFVREIKKYLKSKDLAFMVFLVFHSAPGHLQDPWSHPSKYEVEYLAKGITSLQQLLDQGIITICKSHYSCCIICST